VTGSTEIHALELVGASRQQGQAHGEACRPVILEGIQRWKDSIAMTFKVDPDQCIGEFMGETDFAGAVRRTTPRILEEVKGIAEAVQLPFDTLFAWSCMDEFWWYARARSLSTVYPWGDRCSALGVFGQIGTPPMIAQNVDVPTMYDGLQTLLRLKDANSDLESYVFTFAGCVGAMGVNNRSIGVCANTLLQLDHSTDGLPYTFVVRGILDQSTWQQAVHFVRNTKHASGENYIIGGPERLIDLEASAGKVVDYVPSEGVGKLCHTNHPLANEDQGMYSQWLGTLDPRQLQEVTDATRTHGRYTSLESWFKSAGDEISFEGVKSVLRSHGPDAPICVHSEQSFTSASIIMVLSGSPELHITFGPPCGQEYERFTF
jgi:isopenicillin-N N-acyltransferase-like protein